MVPSIPLNSTVTVRVEAALLNLPHPSLRSLLGCTVCGFRVSASVSEPGVCCPWLAGLSRGCWGAEGAGLALVGNKRRCPRDVFCCTWLRAGGHCWGWSAVLAHTPMPPAPQGEGAAASGEPAAEGGGRSAAQAEGGGGQAAAAGGGEAVSGLARSRLAPPCLGSP